MKPQAYRSDVSLVAGLSHEQQAYQHDLKVALWLAVGLTIAFWSGLRAFKSLTPAPKFVPIRYQPIVIDPFKPILPPPGVIVDHGNVAPPPGNHVFGRIDPRDVPDDITYTRNDSASAWMNTNVKPGDSTYAYLPPKPPDDDLPDIDYHPALTAEPALVGGPPPEYPALARQLHQEGRAYVHVLLDRDGSVMQARLAKSSGYDLLDQAAEEGAKKFRFSPAMQGERSVRVWVAVPVDFQLEG
jgi:TonB family protein